MDQTKPVQEVSKAINSITVQQKLVNGTEILLIYYGIILAFFIMDLFFRFRSYTDYETKKPKNILTRGILNLYLAYRKYSLFTLNSIFFIICVIIIIYHIGFQWKEIFDIFLSFLIFTVFVHFVMKIFIDKEGYENDATVRSIGIISDILLGNFLCFYMSFITAPELLATFGGLCAGLLLCFFLMLRAIFNPQILIRTSNRSFFSSQAFGMMKGMLAVLICMLAILYMMLYSCYVKSPDFFVYEYQRKLDTFDLLYFLVVSFTTIGYGDVIPVRYEGLYYSQLTAILIGFASIFTTTCFIAAVVSAANSLAQNSGSSLEFFPKKAEMKHKETILHDRPRRKDSVRKKPTKKHPYGL